MDQLEENPRSYIGKPITVEAEVEEILGPRLLAVDSFWVQAAQGNEQLLVVPASPADVKVTAGQTVSIDGVVLQMPAAMRQRAEKAQQGADEIYVFASLVQTAK